jgi:hypothetical protein
MSATKRVTFRKADADYGVMSAYEVMLDGVVIGTVSKVRERYLRRLGGHRGNNVPASRTAWRVTGDRLHHDTRDEAVIAAVANHLDVDYGTALDIVRGKD